jgi:hypothetical protein
MSLLRKYLPDGVGTVPLMEIRMAYVRLRVRHLTLLLDLRLCDYFSLRGLRRSPTRL